MHSSHIHTHTQACHIFKASDHSCLPLDSLSFWICYAQYWKRVHFWEEPKITYFLCFKGFIPLYSSLAVLLQHVIADLYSTWDSIFKLFPNRRDQSMSKPLLVSIASGVKLTKWICRKGADEIHSWRMHHSNMSCNK